MKIKIRQPKSSKSVVALIEDQRTPQEAILLKEIGARQSRTTPSSWSLPVLASSLERYMRRFPRADVDLSVIQYLTTIDSQRAFEAVEIRSGDDADLDDDSSWPPTHPRWNDLFPFQREAVHFLTSSLLSGGLLALSPGLGKTLTALVAAEAIQAKDVLIVAPRSLLPTWREQARYWLDRDLPIFWRTAPEKAFRGWAITNYDTLVNREAAFHRRWDLVIFDESILVKNVDSKRWKKASLLRRVADRAWLLSGSPISRYGDDLFGQFKLIEPSAFPSYWRFADQYCLVNDTVWGRTVVGTHPDIDLQDEFRDLMFVRNQDDVLDLPPMTSETIYVDLTDAQASTYRRLMTSFILDLESGSTMVSSRIAQITKGLQIVSNLANIGGPDESSKLDLIMDLLQSRAFELPVVIWTHWRATGLALGDRLKKAGIRYRLELGGSETTAESVERLQVGDIDALVISLGVGKFGHTMTNARTMIHVDRVFDADALYQSLLRIRRIGLDHSPLQINLHAPGTLDDLVQMNLSGKMVDIARITNADLVALLRSLGVR